jgi:hypothetical protein
MGRQPFAEIYSLYGFFIKTSGEQAKDYKKDEKVYCLFSHENPLLFYDRKERYPAGSQAVKGRQKATTDAAYNKMQEMAQIELRNWYAKIE